MFLECDPNDNDKQAPVAYQWKLNEVIFAENVHDVHILKFANSQKDANHIVAGWEMFYAS